VRTQQPKGQISMKKRRKQTNSLDTEILVKKTNKFNYMTEKTKANGAEWWEER
jgi:hypothetical protein